MVVSGRLHGVEGLGEVRCSLQDDLLREFLGVSGVARNEFAQAVEAVVYVGLCQCCKKGIKIFAKALALSSCCSFIAK